MYVKTQNIGSIYKKISRRCICHMLADKTE